MARATVTGRTRRYGISAAQYNELLAQQDGLCAICGGNGYRELDVDHDHATGRVRGLLCGNCNLGVGHLRENPDTMRAAAAYLEAHH